MNNTTKIIVGVVVIVLIVWGISAARKYGGTPTTTEPIKIGVIAGVTGQYAPAGEAYVKGFNLAMEQWNNSHPTNFSAVFEDDNFNAVKGLSAYQKLSGVDKVDAYAVVSTFTIDAIYDMLHQEKRPVTLGFEQSKPAENDNIFQVLPAAKPIQFGLGQKVKELGHSKPVAVVSNNTPAYQNFYDGFNDGFGGNVKKFEIGTDVTGIRSQALAIVQEKPDVVAFFMAPRDGALLVKEILKITNTQNRPYFVFDQSIQSGGRDYEEILGSDMPKIDGSLVSMSKNDFTPEFTASYEAKYNETPPFASDIGFNSFIVLANTYEENDQVWIDNIKKVKLVGADGEVSFDETGLRTPNVFFGQLSNGKVST